MLSKILSQPIFKRINKQIPNSPLQDCSHDYSHSLRVAQNAIMIAKEEGGDLTILIAAALLHDIENLPKNHPKSSMSAQLSAQKALEILTKVGFPQKKLDPILDAIEHHSYSRGLIPKTDEGKIFQDADRLDALGAIGIARTFATGQTFNNRLYNPDDPFIKKGRTPNDKTNSLDHFFVKLSMIPKKMLTPTGKKLAYERLSTMKQFLTALEQEITP